NRRNLAHVRQLLYRQPLGVDVRVGEIEPGWEGRDRHEWTPHTTLSSARTALLHHRSDAVKRVLEKSHKVSSETCSDSIFITDTLVTHCTGVTIGVRRLKHPMAPSETSKGASVRKSDKAAALSVAAGAL